MTRTRGWRLRVQREMAESAAGPDSNGLVRREHRVAGTQTSSARRRSAQSSAGLRRMQRVTSRDLGLAGLRPSRAEPGLAGCRRAQRTPACLHRSQEFPLIRIRKLVTEIVPGSSVDLEGAAVLAKASVSAHACASALPQPKRTSHTATL